MAAGKASAHAQANSFSGRVIHRPVYALWASGVIAGRRGDAKFFQGLTGFYIKAAREALK